MNKCRIVFQRLHQIRLHCLLQQHRHSAIGFNIAAEYRTAVTAISHNDISQTAFQISQIISKAQNSHDFGCHGNVKPSFTRESVSNTAKAAINLAQCPIIHIKNTAESHTADIDVLLIPPVDVIINQRGQQVMC